MTQTIESTGGAGTVFVWGTPQPSGTYVERWDNQTGHSSLLGSTCVVGPTQFNTQAETFALAPATPQKEHSMSYGPLALVVILGVISYYVVVAAAVWWSDNRDEIKRKDLPPFQGWMAGCAFLLGTGGAVVLLAALAGLAWLLRGF